MPEAVGEMAHAEAVEPGLVEEFECGAHDVVDLERIASTGASRAGHGVAVQSNSV